MLKVIGPKGGRTFRVLWALEEMEHSFEHEIANPRSAPVFAVNPLGQAPAIIDDGEVITDSLAILNYLADRAEKLTFPPGSARRARMDARINFVLTEMEAPLWLTARHKFVLPENQRRSGVRDVAAEDFARAEPKFELLIGDSEFFAGDQFTIADIVAGHVANWAESAKFEISSAALADYLTRMKARPAWARALAG